MAKLETLTDRFEGSGLRTALWTQFTGGGATFTYDITGASVVYPASTTATTDGDITTVASYDLTASYAFINVTAVPNVGAVNTDARFLIGTTTNGLTFLFEGGSIFAQKYVASAKTNILSATYSATTHAWWRIRENAGTTFWETSADGLTWTVFTSQANPITVTALSVQLAGTAFGTSTSPGNFSWRSLNIPPSTSTVGNFRPGKTWINRYARNERRPYSIAYSSSLPVVNASIAQLAATITATGGTQVTAAVQNNSITQVAATVTALGGTQAVTSSQIAAIAQAAASVTAAGGTQTVATVNNSAITQTAANITASGGTQGVVTINNVSLAQLAAIITAAGGAQTIVTLSNVAISQTAANITATGGTQSVGAQIDISISQLAATITAAGGTQTVASIQNAAISQANATLTATGGTQIITTGLTNSGDIKVYLNGGFTAKPVKVWSGSAWVQKPLKVWNGSAWVKTNY